MMNPDLTIVIVNWNTRDLLGACLASLEAGLAGLVAETIVVDNGSADGSVAYVRREFPWVELVDAGCNLGFTAANNLVLRRARGAAVLLLNPDTVCRPGSLATLHAFLMSTPRAGAVGPTLIDGRGQPTFTYGNQPALHYHLLEFLGPHRRRWPPCLRRRTRVGIPSPGDRTRRVGYVFGACMMISGDALRDVGLLDERFFMYFEETDWCARAAGLGWDVHHVAGAEVVHLEGRAAARAGDFALAQFQHSYRLFVAKHHGARRVPLFRAVMFLEYGLKGAARRLLSLRPGPGRARDAALADNFLRQARLQLRGDVAPTPPR
jgi:GT2 family glycosyltransferase